MSLVKYIIEYYIWLLSVLESSEKASERKVSKRKSPLYIRCATPEPGKSATTFPFQLFSFLPSNFESTAENKSCQSESLLKSVV